MRPCARWILVLLCLLGSSIPASAQWGYIGFAQVTIDNTSGGQPFPSAQIGSVGHMRPTQAFCQIEGADVRWTVDGTAPTTSVGTLGLDGSMLPAFNGTEILSDFRAIRTAGTNATLNCSFFAGGTLPFREWGGTVGSSGGGGGGGAVTQSGAWTVQPGNTANSTAWLVTGTGGTFPVTGTFWQATQPVSIASVPSHAVTNAGTFVVQAAQSGTWDEVGINDSGNSITVDNGGTFAVQAAGTKTNNNAVPGATNIGALIGIANASAPTWTETNMVGASFDLSGAMRVTGSAGTTQYAEDAAHSSGNSIVAIGAVRSDTTPSSTAGTAGDYAIPNLDANGRLYTNTVIYTAAGAAATLASDVTEDAAETAGGTGPAVMSVRRDTAASSAGTTGDNASFNTDSIGRLWTSGAVVEDAAETADDALVSVGSVRRDTPASSAGTTGDNATINTDETGSIYVAPQTTNAGGSSNLKYSSAGATEDEHTVCSGPCNLYSVIITNTNAAVRYFRCANIASTGATTPGTSTPVIDLAISAGGGFVLPLPVAGTYFSTGLTCWLVTGAADTDVVEVASNEIKLFYTFKQ